MVVRYGRYIRIDILNITNKHEQFHTRVCKNILGMKKYTSNIACRSELGRYPISINVICNTFSYFIRLQHMPNDSLLGEATKVQKSMYISKQKNIFSFINRLCVETGQTIHQSLPGTDICKSRIRNLTKKFKLNLMDKYREIQTVYLKNSSKLELLAATKPNIKFERYLDIQNKEHRIALTKLRVSAHNFPIESGGKQQIPRHVRKCNLCKANVIGDEFHVLMQCSNSSVQSKRINVYKSIIQCIPTFNILPMKEKCMYLFSCCDEMLTQIIAPFINECMKCMPI